MNIARLFYFLFLLLIFYRARHYAYSKTNPGNFKFLHI